MPGSKRAGLVRGFGVTELDRGGLRSLQPDWDALKLAPTTLAAGLNAGKKRGALLAKGTLGVQGGEKVLLLGLGVALRRGVVLFAVDITRRLVLFLVDLLLLAGGQ